MNNKYYYLDVSLELAQDLEITPAFFKNHILQSVNQLFGEVGAAIPIDILKYQPVTKQAIIRVPSEHYVKLRSSLTLCGNYAGVTCAYRIHNSAPLLLALLGDSRDYVH